MITCQHAKHVFDQYLDGELPPSLQAELHAHQLNCSECQGELALLEACGDVIAFDRREPMVSASFTDRVLLAHRAQLKPTVRRNWSRLVLSVASPMAAAAAIAFAVILIAPSGPEKHVVAGAVANISRPLEQILTGGDKSSERIRPDSLSARELPAGFVDVILGPVVERTKSTVDSTKRSIEQLDSLVRLGFTGANDALAAGSRSLESDHKPTMDAVRSSNGSSEPDLLDPSSLRQAPGASDQLNGSEVDDTVEAL